MILTAACTVSSDKPAALVLGEISIVQTLGLTKHWYQQDALLSRCSLFLLSVVKGSPAKKPRCVKRKSVCVVHASGQRTKLAMS